MIYLTRTNALRLLTRLHIEREKFLCMYTDYDVAEKLLLCGCPGYLHMNNQQLESHLRRLHHMEFEPAAGDGPGETSMAEYRIVDDKHEPPVTGTDPRDYDAELKDNKPRFTKKRI